MLRYGFSALGAVPVLSLAVSCLHFGLRDPDRLQSEEFVSRQQELMLLARKAQPPVPANPEPSAGPASITRTEEDRP